MAQNPVDTTFLLRNYPDDDALKNRKKYSKALSFSPDILPVYGTNPDHNTLVDPATWRGFSGLPIVGGDVNNVYIRGHGSGGPHVATLRVIPSELILWPQVWYNENPVPSGPVVITGGNTLDSYVSDGPLQFRPPLVTGHTYSLVANVFKPDNKGAPPTPPFDLKNFGVDEYIRFLSNDETFTFYNVIVADPTLKQISATTRLRMFGHFPVSVGFRLEWHTGTPVPDGLEVSLFDDRGRVAVPRIPLKFFGERMVLLEPSYDGTLMLNIYAPAGNPHFEPYSGLSLQVIKGELLPIGPRPLLGALNVIFEPHATRNIRFASPSATQLRNTPDNGEPNAQANANQDCGPIPVTKPAATGWWSRALLTDTNNFPHTPIGGSPDIQPVGTDPSQKDFISILQDPAVDYSAANNIELVGNANNYFFLRGHSTLADIDVQSRLFAVNASTVNYPSHYLAEGLKAQVIGDGGLVNEQSISVANANQFYLFEKPFEISNPPGDSNNHYCLIAEVRQKRKCSPVWPGWPSDTWANYATLADFEAWCLSNPLMCWRNINWEPAQPGGKKVWEWTCSTELCIPDSSSYSSFWSIVIECDNTNIPAGCKWTLVCDDNKLFPNGTCFSNVAINTKSPAFVGCHFTGATPGYKAKLTLTVTWSDGGDSKIPPPTVHWRLGLTETLVSPILHLALDAPPDSETWPFYVTKDYPYIGGNPNPSPLPTFKQVGLNKWPYADALQFHLGQVTIAAKVQ